jgi:hypothetical protein
MPTFCTLRPNLELSTQITFDGDRCRFDSSFCFSKQFIEFIPVYEIKEEGRSYFRS